MARTNNLERDLLTMDSFTYGKPIYEVWARVRANIKEVGRTVRAKRPVQQRYAKTSADTMEKDFRRLLRQ